MGNSSSSSNDSGFQLTVSSIDLMKLAHKFANRDLFAMYQREVQAGFATNFTALQAMDMFTKLHSKLAETTVLKKLGDDIITCISPFLIRESAPEVISDQNGICNVFQISNDGVQRLRASHEEIQSELGISAAEQTRIKEVVNGKVGNLHTVFYKCLVSIRYSPRKRTFDLFYGYVFFLDRSFVQIFTSGERKKQRLAALELEAISLVGQVIARSSGNLVTLLQSTETDNHFEGLQRVLAE